MFANRRLSVTILIPVFVISSQIIVFIAILAVSNSILTRIINQALSDTGQALINLSEELLFDPVYRFDLDDINQILRNTESAYPSIVYMAVRDGDGQMLALTTDAWQPSEELSRNQSDQALQENKVFEQDIQQFKLVTGPILAGSQQIGTVEIGFDTTVLREQFRPTEQLRLFIILMVILLIISSTIVILIARRATTLLNDLVASAEGIGAGEMDTPISMRGPAELTKLASALETMRRELKTLYESLERRVSERTRALEISAQVSSSLSAILEREALINGVVNQIRDAFDFYYTQIYLYDPESRQLNLAAATGEAGTQMLIQGHQVDLDRGLVGRAASQNEAVLISDVSQSAEWLPNPLLPETKSEIAVPISLGNQIIGVLDVQHNQMAGLDESTATLLQSVANQVAVALQNAELFQRTQQRADYEARINLISQKIQNAGTIEQVLQVAAQELGNTTGARVARVQLQGSKQNQPG